MRKRLLCAVLALALLCGGMSWSAMAAGKASIKLGGKVGLMYEGASVTLKPAVKNVTRKALKWKSSDKGVLKVTGGELKAVSPGRAVVTVTGGGAKAKCGVVVLPRTVRVAVGEKASLPRGGVERYRAKDKAVAAVSKKGVITGRKAGTTAVLVTYGSQKLVVKVEVRGEDSRAAKLKCASQTDQIVLVEYEGGSSATLSVHEKKGGVWRELASVPAYVGKNGVGKTKEGDKRTPSGVYNLTTPFGIKADPGAAMAYTKVTKYHYWCGASSSGYYNQLVDTRKVDRACTGSDERLIDYKGVYNYCLFIDYNADGTPHKGSCIFLHCTGKNKYTAGCVAVRESVMKKIVQWARPGAKIAIIDT